MGQLEGEARAFDGLDEAALARVPPPADKRIAVRATPAGLRSIRSGHPWLYDGSITDVSHDGAAGDLAVLFDDRRRFVAIGLWDPDSPIRLRVLHAGKPRTIDHAFLSERLQVSIEHRTPLERDPDTTAYRLVHGESDALPGLVIDRYESTAVVRVDTAAWLPHLAGVLDALAEVVALDRIVLRMSRRVADGETFGLADGTVLAGTTPTAPIEFLEHGLRFGADVVHGQKTGHFLDQRDNRARVGTLSRDRRVLDVFSCTGGFSVHAAAAGARAVHSIDLAQPAISTAVANMERNHDRPEVRACDHTTEVADAFDALSRYGASGRTWDVVVIDPPSFAARRSAVPGAMRAYRRLTELGLAVTATGGVLVQSSCSSRIDADDLHRQIIDAATGAGHDILEIDRTGHPLDHPITIPESRYLKTSYLRLDP